MLPFRFLISLFAAYFTIVLSPCMAAASFTESSLSLLPGDTTTPSYSGVAMGVVDMDGDGADDIVRFRSGKDLYIEYQTTSGAPFTTYTGHTFANIRVAVAAADHDGNGKRDLTCGGYSGGTHLLTANAGGTALTLSTLADTDIVMQGMNFVDIDNDGDVDLFACDDVEDNQKYRNDGSGTFPLDNSLIDTFIPSQTDQSAPNAGNYASLWTDYDNDGDLDMYLSKCRQRENDSNQLSRINRLFRQNIDGTFTDVATAAGLDSGDQSWCTDFADVDNDGDLDAFIINHKKRTTDGASALYINQGDGTYLKSTTSGIDFTYMGIQAAFRDFDNDGYVDLLLSSVGTPSNGYKFYLNDGDGTFTDQTGVFTTSTTGSGTALSYIQSFAVGDLNSDGWLDLYVGRATGLNIPSGNRDLLYLNDGGTNHYLTVALEGGSSNPDGIGARMELHGAWGVQVREVRSGEGYGVMHSLTKHFGLGDTTTIDKLVVRWPSGAIDVIHSTSADQLLTVIEGTFPPSFAEWQALMFTSTEISDPLISGPDANPDSDLLVNLFEWYFRTHPKQHRSSRDQIAAFSIENVAPDMRRLVLTIDRQPVTGADEFAETTGDLGTWLKGLPHVEIVTDTDSQLILRSKPLGPDFSAIRFVLELLPE